MDEHLSRRHRSREPPENSHRHTVEIEHKVIDHSWHRGELPRTEQAILLSAERRGKYAGEWRQGDQSSTLLLTNGKSGLG
jgi:hypothetical protein